MRRPGLPKGWKRGLTKKIIDRVLAIERTRFSQLPRLAGRHADGYEMIRLCRRHPYANSGGWQFAHRLAVMRSLGRVLDTYEHVHHVDGDKTNNRLSNLDIMEDVDHGHYHYGRRLGCGREFRARSFAGRELDFDAKGAPKPYLRPEHQGATA